ncbi:ubiquinone biosynthesis accessory factor UbiJ [Gayadomonas joobiniege]|uniref:ubiquinone biosynthesis accessory factor UbiJ n=1 Tax=Gayadomonas joobiniege TaxID=1234606 RepID=UPI000361CA9B|nr:SCP2 sterol-binding domain-containing protein [Gayadomonas joobiniege]
MPAASLISSLLEHTINYWLKQTGSHQQVPARLLNKQVAISISELNLQLQMHIQEDGYLSIWSPVNNADCHIITTLGGLIKLQQPEQITALIKAGEVDIEGDVQLAQAYADWLKGSLIYWQDVLAGIVSDPVAAKLTQAGEQFAAAAQQQLQNSQRNFGNIIWDEKRLAPHPLEVKVFVQDLRQLRQDTDRLTARIEQLEQTINNR